jgi:hypothetical protein
MLAAPSEADVVFESDPAGDNAGYSTADPSVATAGALDIASITHRHRAGGYRQPDVLVHEVEMHAPWSNDALASGPGKDADMTLFFTHAEGHALVSLTVADDGSLSAPVTVSSWDTEETQVGFARAWRSDARTVVVEVTRHQIWPGDPERLSEYRWNVSTSDFRCDQDLADESLDACYDFAPDDEPLRHVLSGPGSTDCRDGFDNDGDGAADYGEDPGCSSADDPFEGLSDADGDCNRICEGPAFELRLDRGEPGASQTFLRARVESSLEQCISDRIVSFFRLSRGPDQRLHRTGVQPNGRWLSYLPDRPGRYYAVVHARETSSQEGHEAYRCALIDSNVVRLSKKTLDRHG